MKKLLLTGATLALVATTLPATGVSASSGYRHENSHKQYSNRDDNNCHRKDRPHHTAYYQPNRSYNSYTNYTNYSYQAEYTNYVSYAGYNRTY